jgi:beta-exotoxin I transport system permease protein
MNRATVALVVHSLRRIRPVVIGISVVLAAFQFLLTQVAAYLMRTQAFGMLASLVPEFVRSLAGPSMLAFMSFAGVVSLGYFHPIVLISLLGLTIAIATEPAAEIENRFVDLTLSRPIARAHVVARTIAVLVVCGLIVLGAMSAGTWIGLACCTPANAPRPSGAIIRSLALNLALIAWCWGGIALALAAAAKRRATASGLAGITVLASYLLDYLGRVWDPARRLSEISPFHYFEPMSLVTGAGLSAPNVATLVAAGLVGTAASFIIFSRRDL